MRLAMKAALGVATLTIFGAGAAYAADGMKCCCKDDAGRMACCDKKAPADAPKPPSEHPRGH